jgi:uncharacterized protein YbjT (DUF2867 family)
MNTILGASGQVGSAVVSNLLKSREPVKGVIRDKKKANDLKKKGAAVAIADIHDKDALADSFADATSVLVLTPESGQEEDVLGEMRDIIQNYRSAIEKSPVKKLVGISSIGAQHERGTGNIQMSYMLEHGFEGLAAEKIFVRPSYYFSNWLPYLDTIKKDHVLPTFFPLDLAMPMISPMDVAEIIAQLMTENKNHGSQVVYELEGPEWINSNDVAKAFSEVLKIDVKAQQMPRSEWDNTMKSMGLSDDGAKNFIEMTEAVINGKVMPEKKNTTTLKGKTTFKEHLQQTISGK